MSKHFSPLSFFSLSISLSLFFLFLRYGEKVGPFINLVGGFMECADEQVPPATASLGTAVIPLMQKLKSGEDITADLGKLREGLERLQCLSPPLSALARFLPQSANSEGKEILNTFHVLTTGVNVISNLAVSCFQVWKKVRVSICRRTGLWVLERSNQSRLNTCTLVKRNPTTFITP